MIKYIKAIFGILVAIVLVYTLIDGVTQFWRGYHQLDTAQNFLQLGYSQDLNVNSQVVNLKDIYLDGLNKMTYGFGWVCFDVVIGVFLGWLLK